MSDQQGPTIGGVTGALCSAGARPPVILTESTERSLRALALQQHMLCSPHVYAPSLGTLNLSGKTVVELGVGSGVLSKLVLEAGARTLIGFEIDPNVVPGDVAKKMDLRIQDFTAADLSLLASADACLIANPPYSQLQFVREQILDKYAVANVQLMIPERALKLFPDFKVVSRMNGTSFRPVSEGTHLIIRKGFDGAPRRTFDDSLIGSIADRLRVVDPDQQYGVARRIVFCMTDNERKIPEVKRNLARYGVEVVQVPVHESTEYLEKLFAISIPNVTIKAVTKESTQLLKPKSTEFAEICQFAPVDHYSALTVFSRSKENDGTVTSDCYEHRTNGLIDLSGRLSGDGSVFGWDDIFTVRKTMQTYHQLAQRGLKVSSRDMVWSEFLKDKIYYHEHADLKFSPLSQKSTIDFANSVGSFIEESPYFGNRFCRESGLHNIFMHVVNEGTFFRSAINRREKNYWLPGLNAGIPLVQKKDEIHECTFMAHDIGHMLIPDLLVTSLPSAHERRVYIAYRMMSEAMTLVLADMAFVDSLKKSGFDYDYSKRKIYPLYQATGVDLTPENMSVELKRLLHANMRYCLRGDDTQYRELVGDSIAGLAALDDFKDKYMPFFVEDFRWTGQNIEQLSANASFLAEWWSGIEAISERHQLGLRTVRDFAKSIPENPDDMVAAVFERIFSDYIQPAIATTPQSVTEEERRSKGFVRYMAGQMGIFAKYADSPDAAPLSQVIARELLNHRGTFSLGEIDRVRALYDSFVDNLYEQNRIQSDDAATFKSVYPLFEPYFVYYDAAKETYTDLAEISRRMLGS